MNSTTLEGCFLHYRFCVLALTFLFISSGRVYGEDTEPYEEIALSLSIQRIGSVEIPAIVSNGQAYLSVKSVFDFLKIKTELAADLNSATGFLMDSKAQYKIDKQKNEIVFREKTFGLKPNDLLRTESDLYLRSDYYGLVFGLSCTFNFRTLSVKLDTKLELPVMREMKLEEMRKNINKLKGNREVDSVVKSSFSLFHLGVADWSLTSTHDKKHQGNTRAGLILGAMVAGGEATIGLNYDNSRPLNQQDQYYRWHYVNNDHAVLTQITAGRIFSSSTASLNGPLNGIQFSNTPTTYRKSFGTYRISKTTEPFWTVELYVNNVLVDYVKADASGFYSFDVPLVYGNSAITLRVYGPYGEASIQEEQVSIPFTFLPAKKLEYNVSGGRVDDRDKSFFTRAEVNYGLSSRITVAAGAEYLSAMLASNPMPFIKSSARLQSGLLISAEYTQGVRTKGTLNYQLPGGLQLDADYTKYVKGQTAIRYNYLEERKMVLSVPISGKGFSTYSRFTFNQYVLPTTKITNAEFLLSSIVSGISTNLTTNVIYTDAAHSSVFSELSLSFRLPMSIRMTPRAQYQYKQKNISMIKAELEKTMGRMGSLNFSYENNRQYQLQSLTLGLRLNLSMMQTAFSVLQSNQTTALVESARGSLIYNDQTKRLKANKESNTGKGGLTILPYLDLNGNGHRDAGESVAEGLKIKSAGSAGTRKMADGTIEVSGLEANTEYVVELDDSGFQNISFQLKKKSFRTKVEPNHYKLIEVAVTVAGEVSGQVYLDRAGERAGLGRIIVHIYDDSRRLVASTISQEDGYFVYLGLPPGNYTAKLYDMQLEKLQLQPSKDQDFKVKMDDEGDVITGLVFLLTDQTRTIKKNKDTSTLSERAQ
jgi:hypothetical protein